jgi:hypothetical protein
VDGPLPRGIAGAQELDMLTIVPAGNDGSAGPAYGSIAGPGGAESALTVAAADGRVATPTVRVMIRAGLRVLFEDDVPLGGAPSKTVTADVAPVTRRTAASGIEALFSDGGMSDVAGRAVLVPRGALSDETVEESTSAGALAVLVDGALPAGAFSLDVPPGVPVVGLTGKVVAEMRALIASGIPVAVSIGDVDVASRTEAGSIAAFSSRGLVLDGSLKPSLAAPGVSVPTSEPGRGDDGDVRFGTISGTSAAAAVTAGVAALLAQGRPSLDARALQGVLVGSAQRADLDPTASGAGVVDLRAAVQQEAYADPSLLSFGAAGKEGAERVLHVTNVSTRRLAVSIGNTAIAPKGVEISIDPQRVRIRPGRSADVTVTANTSQLSSVAGAATGELVLRTADSPDVHVPWAVAVPAAVDLVSRIRIEMTGKRVSDATPAALSFVAGAVSATPEPQVRSVGLLDVELWRGDTRLGLLARRRELLPGRYTFGLTGRGATGSRLRRGTYTIRLLAFPGDGTRKQVDTIPYRVR